MSREEVRGINDAWAESLKEDYDWGEFYMYEPFSDEYWAEKQKIVFCNTNVYGYNVPQDLEAKKEFDETPVLIWEIFKKWLDELDRKKTIPRSALFMYFLYETLQGHSLPEKNKLEEIFYSKENLQAVDSVLRRMTYMNLENRVGDSTITDAESREIKRYFSEFDGLNATWFKKLISALEPDVFIITGTEGLNTLNNIYKNEFHLESQGVQKYGKTIFVNIYHPSPRHGKFTNEYILQKSDEIAKYIKEKLWTVE